MFLFLSSETHCASTRHIFTGVFHSRTGDNAYLPVSSEVPYSALSFMLTAQPFILITLSPIHIYLYTNSTHTLLTVCKSRETLILASRSFSTYVNFPILIRLQEGALSQILFQLNNLINIIFVRYLIYSHNSEGGSSFAYKTVSLGSL